MGRSLSNTVIRTRLFPRCRLLGCGFVPPLVGRRWPRHSLSSWEFNPAIFRGLSANTIPAGGCKHNFRGNAPQVQCRNDGVERPAATRFLLLPFAALTRAHHHPPRLHAPACRHSAKRPPPFTQGPQNYGHLMRQSAGALRPYLLLHLLAHPYPPPAALPFLDLSLPPRRLSSAFHHSATGSPPARPRRAAPCTGWVSAMLLKKVAPSGPRTVR